VIHKNFVAGPEVRRCCAGGLFDRLLG